VQPSSDDNHLSGCHSIVMRLKAKLILGQMS
jgi:hypothetical protein